MGSHNQHQQQLDNKSWSHRVPGHTEADTKKPGMAEAAAVRSNLPGCFCCHAICEPTLILSSVILRDFHFAVSTFHVKSTLNWDITQFVGFLLKQHLDAFSKDKSHAILKLVECIN